jgi:hypothetical protein
MYTLTKLYLLLGVSALVLSVIFTWVWQQAMQKRRLARAHAIARKAEAKVIELRRHRLGDLADRSSVYR